MADLDIAALKEARARMTPGVWVRECTGRSVFVANEGYVASGSGEDAEENAAGIVLTHNSADAMIARIEALEAENARLRDPQLADYEAEAALASEGVYVWGPDGEEFERMFRVAMEARAALATKGEK